MRKVVIVLFLFSAVFFQFCSSSKKASKHHEHAVTYEGNIKPIIVSTCSPCHIEGKGNKKPLDNYANASANVNDIINRIQKNPDEKGFMPMRHPKLDEATIRQFVAWKEAGTPAK